MGVIAVLLTVLWQLLPAATVPYPIVYVRAVKDGSHAPKFAEVTQIANVEPSDLMLLHPDGKEEVLVAGRGAGITDPCVSFDGQSVYYTHIPHPMTVSGGQLIPTGGADIYRIHVPTRQITRLTNQEYEPNTGVTSGYPNHITLNMGACPVARGKVVFASNRRGFVPPRAATPVTMQLFVMNQDGSDVEAIAPMTIGSALHPTPLKDGRVMFSSAESQGLRNGILWSLWGIWPDGRKWEPLFSGLTMTQSFHFQTQLSSGEIVVEDYYNLNQLGFGSLYAFPASHEGPAFHPGDKTVNPPLTYTTTQGQLGGFQYPFTPRGVRVLTPFSTPADTVAGPGMGKVTHPSGAPNNDLLLTYAPGAVVNNTDGTGIYLIRNGAVAQRPSDLVKVKDEPGYYEYWPRALVPYSAIYGVSEPHAFPFLPNDGTVHPVLPAGTPYGIVGTSSMYNRESAPGDFRTDISWDGLDSFMGQGSSNWVWQGSDAGKYDNSEIAYIRIVMLEANTKRNEGLQFWNWAGPVRMAGSWEGGGERHRILGEIPLRKTGVIDQQGNPDTSFWAKVPADTPFTFQLLDDNKRLLTMAQTWHQVRPGEVRVDCGGCHAHSSAPLDFATTGAAKLPPTDLTLMPAHDVEYQRDIEPLIQGKCMTCHRGDPAAAPGHLAFTSNWEQNYDRLANDRDAQWAQKPPAGLVPFYMSQVSRYVRVPQSRRSILMWELYEQRLDGWTNDRWPSTPDPQGWFRFIGDIDFVPGTVDHRPLLTEAERQKFSTWIDLFAPRDWGGGYWKDENRPTLTMKMHNGEVLVGAADAYSGLDEGSLSVTIDGQRRGLTTRSNGVWAASTPANVHKATARVKDRAGNWNELTVTIGPPLTTSSGTSAPAPPRNVRIVR